MRIIAGKFRGRKLKTPKGLATRPVLARIREALFNVLGDLTGLRALDLYAGTGAIGIEALSRGARSLVAVDNGFQQTKIIRENLAALDENAEVIQSNVIGTLEKLHADGRIFDFIFADPPYEQGLAQKTVSAVIVLGMLSEKGILAVTIRHNEELPAEEAEHIKIFDRRYGDTRLVMYRRNIQDK